MKKLFLILVFTSAVTIATAQNGIDSIVGIGIECHDNGEYEKAIAEFEKALKIDPSSPLVHYEMGNSYFAMGEYEKCIGHVDKVIGMNQKFVKIAYMLKGNCLDMTGESQKAIDIYKSTLRDYGDDYLLYYNLGFTYYGQNDFENARDAFYNSILMKPTHASSHLLLAYTMAGMNEKLETILPLYYFLLLEPMTGRSKNGYQLLQETLAKFAVPESDGSAAPKRIRITVDNNLRGNGRDNAAEMGVSLVLAANHIEKNKDIVAEERFIKNTTSVFRSLGEVRENFKADGNEEDLWWDFYIPLFYQLSQSEFMEAYCNYISRMSSDRAEEWIGNNQDKMERFADWISENF